MAADLFGMLRISAMTGRLYLRVGFPALIGPSFAGAPFDLSGTDRSSILVCALLSVVAAGLSYRLASLVSIDATQAGL